MFLMSKTTCSSKIIHKTELAESLDPSIISLYRLVWQQKIVIISKNMTHSNLKTISKLCD